MTPEQLFKEWLEGRALRISEFGSYTEYADLVAQAPQVAALLRITWSDDLIPSYITGIIESMTD